MNIFDSSYSRSSSNDSGSFLPIVKSSQTVKSSAPTKKENLANYSPENILKQVTIANKNDNRLSYSYNEELDLVVVSVRDQNTNKVLRQIPSIDFIDMKIALKHYVGKILDITA